MQQGEWAAAPGPSRMTHRRSRSEGAGGALQDSAPFGGFDLQGAGHMRTISLDTRASSFLQSLQLHDASALHAGMLDAAEAAALDQQYDAAAMAAGAGRPYAAVSPKFAGAAAAAGDYAWQQGEGAVASAGSKRAHSGNGRVGKDSLQEGKKESLHQHKHSFTPALPAVEEAEDAAGPSDRDDEDYCESDSDRECYAATPRTRRSSHSGRGRARRGGYNGRSENELMLLDPKRVKRIMANRQSAARSKERRMNYTTQLENKLQSIRSEVDRLNAQLDGMQGQGKLLLQARTELEQQVGSMQQQLSQAAADNQVLISELFALQSALGLPQALPQPDMAGAAAAAAVAGQPLDVQQQLHGAQYSWQHDGGYSHQSGGMAGSSYPPAAAGTISADFLTGSSRQAGGTAAGGGIPPLPRHQARSPNLQPTATASGQQQAGQQAAGRQQLQQQQGVLVGAVNRPSSPRIPSPSPAAAAAAGAAAAAAVAPAGPMAVAPADGSAAGGAAAPVGMANSTAAAAADMLLDQLAAAGEDAAMTNEDELDMLAALLDDLPIDPAAAAAAVPVDQLPAAPGAGMPRSAQQQQQQQPFPVPLDPAAAAAMPQPPPAGSGSVQGISTAHAPASMLGYGSQQQQQQQLGQFAPLSGSLQRPPPQHPSSKAGTAAATHPGVGGWSVQSPPGSNATAAGFVGGVGGYGRTSPAFSDPLGADGYHDDVSSGSLGGSLTPSTRLARVSDGSSIAAGSGSGSQRVQPPIWQQQQHPALLQAADGGSAAGAAGAAAVVGGAWGMPSPHTPSTVQQPGGSAAAGAAAATAAQGLGGPAGASNTWKPISPAEAAMQQQHTYAAACRSYAGTAGPAAAAAAGGPSSALLLPRSDQVNFVMGANPRQRFSAGKHHRSASAGSVSSLGWNDGDRSWAQQLHSSGSLLQQQQQHNAHHALGPDAAAAAAAGAAAGCSHMVGRASEPGAVLAAFDVHGPPYRSNSSEGMAAMQLNHQQQQQQCGLRQPQHRRSCSYAGSGGGSYLYAGAPSQHWPSAGGVAAAAGGMANSSSCGELSMQLHQHHHQQQQQQQQLEGIHPAALGPGGAAGLPDMSMQQFAGMARAGAPVGADVQALVVPTRIVTTGAGASASGMGSGVGPGMQQQQQQRQHYMM